MQRREFLQQAAGLTTVALAAGAAALRAAPATPLTAAVIGHTGRGNFGHAMELVFADRPGIDVVALADPDPAGRAKVQERVKARRTYADYREMLVKERPQLVCVAPRWTDQHHAMVSAALAVGAHVYCEKPFMRTLAEADDVLAQAQRSGRRIAVAHQGRLAPATLLLKRQLDAGVMGDLLEIRVHGKQDKRAGGEDLLVLETHQFDLVRFFAGDPAWCSARVLHGGRDITRADARTVAEDIGPVAGDEIEALFALPRGVNVHYTSRARAAATAGPWGIEFIGSKGRARLLNDVVTDAFVLHETPMSARGQTREWRPLVDAAAVGAGPIDRGFPAANRRVVDDWLEAIAAQREPVCSGQAAMKSLELIHAVFAAGLSRGRVELPLKDRAHPLERL
ncbi:Gfo/Idh/MocA family protein [Horticoccus sp. 23ND18S-11]|uniref:Gfo/Idh/MocA family protein n=1 Tax=Horticoccus sp. 23ND18S-11 TaxID=3391832 RepID=UPI0039C9A4B2